MVTLLSPGHYRVEHPAPPTDLSVDPALGSPPRTDSHVSSVTVTRGLSEDLVDSVGRHPSFQELLESGAFSSSQHPVSTDAATGAPAAAAPPTRSASWRAALVSGAYAAAREFGAQAVGVVAGLGLRGGLVSAGAGMTAAASTVTAAAFGLATYRAATLASAAIYSEREAPLAVRVAVGAAPLLVVAAAVGYAATAGTLAATGAYLGSKLVQRCVRDFCSNAMAGVLPSSQIVDAAGDEVDKRDLAPEDWGRAVGNALPTTAMYAIQDFLAPSPSELSGFAGLPASWPYIAAASLVEAGRALSGTVLTAHVAHQGGRQLKYKKAGGWKQLKKNLGSLDTLRQARDATAMRQSISVLGDVVGLVAPDTGHPLRRALWKVLRAEVKALGELRGPLVTRGQLALKQQQSQSQPQSGTSERAPVMLAEETGIAYRDDTGPVTIHVRPDHPTAARLRDALPLV